METRLKRLLVFQAAQKVFYMTMANNIESSRVILAAKYLIKLTIAN